MSNIPEGNSLYWAQVIYGKNPEGKSLDMTKDENIEIFQKLWDDNANSISTLSINNARRQAGLEADKSLEDIASLDGFRNDISFEDVAKIQLGFDILTWYFNENPKGKLEYSNGTYLTKEAFSIDNANGVLDFVAERGAIEELLNSYIEANPNSKFAQLYKENLSSALTNYGKTLVSEFDGIEHTNATSGATKADTQTEEATQPTSTVVQTYGGEYDIYSDGTLKSKEGNEKATLVQENTYKSDQFEHRQGNGRYGVYYELVEVNGKKFLGKPKGIYTFDSKGNYNYYEFTDDSVPKVPENGGYKRNQDGSITFLGDKTLTETTCAELMKNGYTADVGFRGNGIKADNGAIVGNKVLDKNGNECGVCYKDDYGRCYYYLYKDYTPPANNEENTESLTRAQNGNEADEPSTPPEQEVADGTLDTDTAIQVSQLVTGGVAIEDAIDIIEDMDLPLAQQAMAMQKYVSDCIQNNIPIEMNFGKTPTEKLLNKYMDLVDINSSDYNPDAFIGLVGAFACVAGKNLAAGERFSGELNATVVQNLINCISNSDMTKDQIKTLNSYINLVDIVELSFSGNQETVLLNKLFNKIYDESSAQSDKSYFEANNPYVSPLTWATSKTFETIQKGLDKTRDYRHKSTQAARSAIMSTANYNVETLVKNLREMGLFNSSARGAAQRACMQYVFDILLADDDAQMSEFRNKYFADIY